MLLCVLLGSISLGIEITEKENTSEIIFSACAVLVFTFLTIICFTKASKIKIKTKEIPEVEYVITERSGEAIKDTIYVYHFDIKQLK